MKSMHDFVNACVTTLAIAVGIFVGVALGHYYGTKDTQKNILTQCQKSGFFFADGVGIMCPSVQNNKEEQK